MFPKFSRRDRRGSVIGEWVLVGKMGFRASTSKQFACVIFYVQPPPSLFLKRRFKEKLDYF